MKTIHLISPPEPSGMSWLYNCFLSLGIKVHLVHSMNRGNMWLKSGKSFKLNPVDDIQKKWAPILSNKKLFKFRDDIEIQFGHTWPTGWQKNKIILFCVRNPFDTLFSSWKRNGNKITFKEYLNVPNHINLLNKIDNWNLFCEAWLHQKNETSLHLVRFEDYKKNAEKTLRNVLKFLNIKYTNKEIEFAISESEYKNASKAENNYVSQTPEWLKKCDDVFWGFYNRKVNLGTKNFQIPEKQTEEHKMIMSRTANVCNEFGYSNKAKNNKRTYYPQKAMLSFYNHLDFNDKWFNETENFSIIDYSVEIEDIFKYIRDINSLLLIAKRAGLMFGEVAELINALQEFKGNYLKHFQNS